MISSESKREIDLIEVRRQAPGRFSEEMISSFSEMIKTEANKLELLNIELADDPFQEKLDIEVRVIQDEPKTISGGPHLFFTFTSEISPAENLKEFREFVNDHAKTASEEPSAPVGAAAGTNF